MKLNLIVGESVFTATMYANASVTDFVSMLPLTLILANYNRQEIRSRLPKRLPINEPKDGVKILAGDINYYTPFRNLNIFYNDCGLSFCHVTLGKIDKEAVETIQKLAGSGPVKVTFQVA